LGGSNGMSLNWKKKWLDDKSGYWYQAKVPCIGWEYIIDAYEENSAFEVGLFLSKNDSDVTQFSKKTFKTKESAMKACQVHLQQTFNKFEQLLNKSNYGKYSNN